MRWRNTFHLGLFIGSSGYSSLKLIKLKVGPLCGGLRGNLGGEFWGKFRKTVKISGRKRLVSVTRG